MKRNLFHLEIDYSKSLKKMMSEAKIFDRGKEFTERNFPFPPENLGKKIKVVTKLFWSEEYYLEIGKVEQEMAKEGFRPSTLPELLALSLKYPELQKEFCILAPGSHYYPFAPISMTSEDIMVPILSEEDIGDGEVDLGPQLGLICDHMLKSETSDSSPDPYYRFLGTKI